MRSSVRSRPAPLASGRGFCGSHENGEPHSTRPFHPDAHEAGGSGHTGSALDALIWASFAVTILALIVGLLLAPRSAEARPLPPGAWLTTTSTWYGPGFYGNRTACGQRYDQRIRGVAVPSAGRYHLPCGTKLSLKRRDGRTFHVTVIDTGGFRDHRFDLSARTAMDLCACSRPYTIRHRWVRGWHTTATTRSPA